MVYAVSTHNNLHYLWVKLSYSNIIPSPTDAHIIIQVFQSCKPTVDFNLTLFDLNVI
jgi:hypothetical protein